ncbi:hypothetical protein VTH82DRAFT_4426 [Thermothelomyces myriococcoides]
MMHDQVLRSVHDGSNAQNTGDEIGTDANACMGNHAAVTGFFRFAATFQSQRLGRPPRQFPLQCPSCGSTADASGATMLEGEEGA